MHLGMLHTQSVLNSLGWNEKADEKAVGFFLFPNSSCSQSSQSVSESVFVFPLCPHSLYAESVNYP